MSNDLNLPWKIGHMETHQASIQDATGLTRIGWLTPAVAEHIVRCVNAHDGLVALLTRYRNETPLGHQPHMIAHEVDEALAKAQGDQDGTR